MRRLFTSAALTAGFLLLMSTAAFAAEVSITDDGPDPGRVEVDVREEIMWTNNTDEDVSLVGEEPNWESGNIAPGATFSIEITQEGTYQYSAEDGSFTGQIIVGGADGEGSGGNAGGDDEEVVEEEPTESGAEGNGGDDDGGSASGGEDEPEESLPQTGIDVTLPGALSLILVALGIGLLVVTQPVRATRQ